jgi:hypothetical protein
MARLNQLYQRTKPGCPTPSAACAPEVIENHRNEAALTASWIVSMTDGCVFIWI